MYVLICENDVEETRTVLATSRSMTKLKKFVKTEYEPDTTLDWTESDDDVVAEVGDDFSAGAYVITKVMEVR